MTMHLKSESNNFQWRIPVAHSYTTVLGPRCRRKFLTRKRKLFRVDYIRIRITRSQTYNLGSECNKDPNATEMLQSDPSRF